MGVIVNELRRLLERHVQEHGVVVWLDPEPHYEPVLEELALPDCRLLRYTGSYFRLREQAESWIRGAERPRLLVYVPVPYEDARLPLAELLALGEILRPGEKGNRNTRLAVIARRALKGLVPDSRLESLEREIEKNQVSLRGTGRDGGRRGRGPTDCPVRHFRNLASGGSRAGVPEFF